MNQRVRERVPTPETDNRLNNSNPFNGIPSIASGVALTAQQLATNPSIFPTTTNNNNSMPILGTLLLSPIKESDSVNNTLSSGSIGVAQSNSILPPYIKSTNHPQFGSLVVSNANHHHDIDTKTTNSFVVLPATTQSDGEIIPVSITTMPLTTSSLTDHHQMTGAIITELPVDQAESLTSSGGKRSSPATPRLGHFFGEFSSSPAPKVKVQRQQSVDSNHSYNPNADSVSTSSNSTTSKRQQAGKKHGEVYV
jgi:bestrophin, other